MNAPHRLSRALMAALCALTLSSCSSLVLGDPVEDSHEAVFDVMWRDFDELYALFEVKQVDWDEVRDTWRPRAAAAADDDALLAALSGALGELNDRHLKIYDDQHEVIWGAYDFEPEVHPDLIKSMYLTETLAAHDGPDEDAEPRVWSGRAGDVGYVRVSTWVGSGGVGVPGSWTSKLDDALDDLADARALIIDVRDNTGGSFFNGLRFAGRFTDVEVETVQSRFRNGPARTDLSDFSTWSIVPRDELAVYDRPVVLLANQNCFSANEWFVLSMSQLPQVTLVGATTGGATGTQIHRELPNGWTFRVTVQDVRDMDGASREAVGISPDHAVAYEEGRDAALERALELLNEAAGS